MRLAVFLSVLALALVGIQPATAAGKPPLPAAEQLCVAQGGGFVSPHEAIYACIVETTTLNLAGAEAICVHAFRGEFDPRYSYFYGCLILH